MSFTCLMYLVYFMYLTYLIYLITESAASWVAACQRQKKISTSELILFHLSLGHFAKQHCSLLFVPSTEGRRGRVEKSCCTERLETKFPDPSLLRLDLISADSGKYRQAPTPMKSRLHRGFGIFCFTKLNFTMVFVAFVFFEIQFHTVAAFLGFQNSIA